jgi:hypothetical protein
VINYKGGKMKKLVLWAVLLQVFFAVNAKEVTGRVLDGYYAPDGRRIHLVAVDLNDDGQFSCIDDVLITATYNNPVYTGFTQDVRFPRDSLITFYDDNARYVTRLNSKRIAETNREVSVRDVIAVNRQSVLEGVNVSRYSDKQLQLAFPRAYARREVRNKLAAANKTVATYYEMKAENERLKLELALKERAEADSKRVEERDPRQRYFP